MAEGPRISVLTAFGPAAGGEAVIFSTEEMVNGAVQI